ncbi:MAG TPA: GNAT family N-acetyltransferase [Candidatus Sulfotelmatobacter sp.]|jgi:N-acetylglutamate synthase-like GNAT family acetyltransferase
MAQVSTPSRERVFELRRGEVFVSTDPARLNLDVIYGYLVQSYWAKGIPRETLARAVENSLCFGAYDASGSQVGFARAVTDFATFAYIADVFVLESHRGQGIGKLLMECIKRHPELQGLRRWTLSTKDAHALYAQFGFTALSWPDRYMEILRPNVYETL